MGPPQHDLPRTGSQDPICRPRSRECLLAGCGRQFTPPCARSCYCSDECRRTARRESQREAERRYRSSEKGRQRRREQCRRRRERLRELSSGTRQPTREGHQNESSRRELRCQRPGCRVRFPFTRRSPLKKFCSALCRQALRRAQLRELRWRGVCRMCPIASLDLCQAAVRGP